MILISFQGKPFNITVIQVYAPTTNAQEAERFSEGLKDLLELTPKKRCPFHHRELKWKSRKSRDIWKTDKCGLGVQNEAGQRLIVLPRECTGHSKHPFPTTQEMTLHMDSPDGQS